MSARLLVLSFVLASCGDKAAVAPASDVATLVAPITDKLTGQRVAGFVARDAAALGATACAVGEVDGLELTICDYGDPAVGAKAMRSVVAGAQSGALRVYGTRVVALADRAKVDPRGQAMNRVLAALDGR